MADPVTICVQIGNLALKIKDLADEDKLNKNHFKFIGDVFVPLQMILSNIHQEGSWNTTALGEQRAAAGFGPHGG